MSTKEARALTEVVTEAARETSETYAAGHERPIGGYAVLLSVYAGLVASLSLVVRRRGRRLPERVGFADLLLLSVATHKLARLVTRDSVTAVVRAPFTQFEGSAGEGEVSEVVRGTGLRHAIGELLTCPFCIAQWIATLLAFALVLAPRATRLAASVFTVVTGADALQFAYAALRKAAD